jgi:hypothetical protein
MAIAKVELAPGWHERPQQLGSDGVVEEDQIPPFGSEESGSFGRGVARD